MEQILNTIKVLTLVWGHMATNNTNFMTVNVLRKNILFQPDSSRVIARFLYNSEQRSAELILRVMALPEKQQREVLMQVLRDYSKRHRSISKVFEKNFGRLTPVFSHLNIDPSNLSTTQKVLIGAYFTMEYSIEAAAFFNPSIIEDPDQAGLTAGEKE